MNKTMKAIRKNEKGTLVLEATFAFFVTMVVMLFLFSLGLMLYQRVLMTVVANEVANDIGLSYKLLTVADNRTITKDDVLSVPTLRYIGEQKYKDKSAERGRTLAVPRLSQSSFAKREGALNVEVESVHDDIGRRHYEVTLSQKHIFLFEEILNVFGVEDISQVEAVAYVQGRDMVYYVNMVRLTEYGLDKLKDGSGILEAFDNVIGFLNNVTEIFT